MSTTITSWIEEEEAKLIQEQPEYEPLVRPVEFEKPPFVTRPLWMTCDHCGVTLYISHLKDYHHTCKHCHNNVHIGVHDRIASLIDEGTWVPFHEQLSAVNPIRFKDKKTYPDRLAEAQERTKFQDAVQTGLGLIEGVPVALGVMNFDFMGGSMGSVVGEKITRLIEYATNNGVILIMVCASGGARMQEGIYSLMQMAKITGALYNYQRCCGLFYVSILGTPTTGGVTASFAMLGDVIIAEPKAVIGFAGRRVIEQTLGEILPDNFQTAEYMLKHGLVDLIVQREHLKQALHELFMFNRNAPLSFDQPTSM